MPKYVAMPLQRDVGRYGNYRAAGDRKFQRKKNSKYISKDIVHKNKESNLAAREKNTEIQKI